MVARPPVRVSIEPMRLEHLPSIHAIEQASFSAPWPANAYRSELETNRLASYLVARVDDDVVGYGGMWLMVDEAHITTFAIHPAWRRQHIGERLLLEFVDVAILRRAREMTLEVRLSNLPARRLYEKFGFRPVGVRPRYYSDDHEDALIMTTLPLADAAMAERIERPPGRDRGSARTDPPGRGAGVSESLILSIESSCDETGIAVIADGRQIVSNVVASQVAMHAASGGIVPEVAARAHLRWIVPVLDEAWADAGVGLAGPVGHRGHLWAGPRGLPVGGRELRQGARVGPRPAAHRRESPRRPRVRRVARRSGDGRAEEPVFPLVALVVSGGHTFLAEMRDHLTYRLLGTTVDDAAGEAFDKVGRLLGLGYPGGPAIGRAAEAATDRATVFPRAWLPGTYDFSFSGLKTAARRIVTDARADAGLATQPDEPLPDATVAELSWGFQDSVTDVLTTKTIRAAREVGARSIVLGGGVAANTALRARLAGEAEALGVPLIVPRPGLCTDNGAMIGAAGARRFAAGDRAGMDLDARPSLPLATRG